MTVQATIFYTDGRKPESRAIASADEFRRLLENLPKKASISLDGGQRRLRNEWKGSQASWPFQAHAAAALSPASHPATLEAAAAGGHLAVQPTPASPAAPTPSPALTVTRDAFGKTAERVETLADEIKQVRADVGMITDEIAPISGRIDELGRSVDQRLTDTTQRLRTELQSALSTEVRPLTSSVDGLKNAVLARPERGEIAALVEEAVAPVEKRVGDAVDRLREENELLAEEGAEQLRRVKTYRPGTIEELRQRIEELQRDVIARREELIERDKRIDALERDKAHLQQSTGAYDREELDKIREQIARDRKSIESQRALEAERDRLIEELADYKKLEERYRAAQEVRSRDLRLEEQLREIDKRRESAEEELARVRDEQRKLQRRFDALLKAHEQVQERSKQLADNNEGLKDDARRLAEEVDALKQAAARHAEERAELAAARRELTAWRTSEEQALAAREKGLDDESRARIATQTAEHDARVRRLDEEHARRMDAVEEHVRAEVRGGYERALAQAQRERDAAVEHRQRAEAESTRCTDEVQAMRTQYIAWQAGEHERELALERHRNTVADLEARRAELQHAVAALTDELTDGQAERDRRFEEKDTALAARLAARSAEVQRIEEGLAAVQSRLQGENEHFAQMKQHHQDELLNLQKQSQDERSMLLKLQEDRRRLEEPATKEVRTKSMRTQVSGLAPSDRRVPFDADLLGNEMKWLDATAQRIEEAEFAFPRRVLEAFHTSLKITHWSPLTVLAGMSGTGKSALSRLYAHFGGLRFLMVPVQPNWDSPHDLFGFFNHIDGRYKATRLLQALTQSQRPPGDEGGFSDGLLLVALDEMNLARVEYYGSELLSRWEARRDGVEAEALQLDVGHGEQEPVKLGGNVLWVGTMNEDETTLSLSDKVLERGNVITFPRPRSLKRRESARLGPAGPWLPAQTFASWTVEPSTLHEKVRDQLKEALEDMNHKLGLVQRSVSHRILQAIENYVANHPRVRAQPKDDNTDKWWQRAFADQLVQKVMPKLRGLDTKNGPGRVCVAAFETILDRYARELVPDFKKACEAPQFMWVSAAYLESDGDQG